MNPKYTPIIIDELGEAYLDWLKCKEMHMYERRHYNDTINWMANKWLPKLIEAIKQDIPEGKEETIANVAGQIVVSLGREAANRFAEDNANFNPQRFEEQFLKSVRAAIRKELDK